jgi:Arc/MetJ-type ribon-helix-helix transcriptional regulator
MVRTLIDLQGPQELIIEKALELGLYKTKAEAIRGAINDLGREYKIFKDAQGPEDELVARKMQQIDNEIKQGKRKVFSEEEVKKKYGFK